LDKGLEDQMERVMTFWAAPMDVERQRGPWRRSQPVEIWVKSSVWD